MQPRHQLPQSFVVMRLNPVPSELVSLHPAEQRADAFPRYPAESDLCAQPAIYRKDRFWHRKTRIPAHGSQPFQLQLQRGGRLITGLVNPKQKLTGCVQIRPGYEGGIGFSDFERACSRPA